MPDRVVVEGLPALRRALKRVEGGLQREIGGVFREAARQVVGRIDLPQLTGRLAGSVRPYGTQREAGVRVGGARVPYAGPVEFGGYPGSRPFVREGRYIFPAFDAAKGDVVESAERGLRDLIRRADLDA